MHDRFKILALFLAAVIVILTVLAGLTFAADNSFKLPSALSNISAYIYPGHYHSFFKGSIFIAFLFLLFLWRALFIQKQH